MKKIVYQGNLPSLSVQTKNAETTVLKSIYMIVWRDAFTAEDSWYHEDSYSVSDYLVETVGYLINSSNPNYYAIASTVTPDGNFCSVINIPKTMVVSKKKIKT